MKSDTESLIDHLIARLDLGKLSKSPQRISGGLLHKIFAIQTTHGKYAVKVLNAEIMHREGVIQNYITSERIAGLASTFISAAPAIVIDDNVLHEVAGKYCLIFRWVDGQMLRNDNVTGAHCRKIGALLAQVHSIDFSSLKLPHQTTPDSRITNFTRYVEISTANTFEWHNLLEKNITMLNACCIEANKAEATLAEKMVISHRDLDPKNVLWQGHEPVIIDWEASGWINPMCELIEGALNWAESRDGSVDKGRFTNFFKGYASKAGRLEANWDAALSFALSSKIGWLEYNLRRSLGLVTSDPEEQTTGTAQVVETINGVLRYLDQKDAIRKWIRELSF